MSMANGLESRVPIADPRVVRFALHTGFDLKLRGGATKWILRQAVADVIPERRAEPPEGRLRHAGRGVDARTAPRLRAGPADVVERARRGRSGIRRAVAAVLDDRGSPYWFDMVWKLVSIEAWARTFLDAPVPAPETQLEYEPA